MPRSPERHAPLLQTPLDFRQQGAAGEIRRFRVSSSICNGDVDLSKIGEILALERLRHH